MAAASPLLSLSGAEGEHGFFEAPNVTGSPERRLILAVLERAILDFVGNEQKEMDEAGEWIFGDLKNPSLEPFTFAWVCLQLDLDMHTIAESIAAMPKRGKHKIAPWYFAKTKQVKPVHHASGAKVTRGNFPHYH